MRSRRCPALSRSLCPAPSPCAAFLPKLYVKGLYQAHAQVHRCVCICVHVCVATGAEAVGIAEWPGLRAGKWLAERPSLNSNVYILQAYFKSHVLGFPAILTVLNKDDSTPHYTPFSRTLRKGGTSQVMSSFPTDSRRLEPEWVKKRNHQKWQIHDSHRGTRQLRVWLQRTCEQNAPMTHLIF